MARQIPAVQPLPGEAAAEAFARFIFDKKDREAYIAELKAEREKLNAAIGDWNKKRKSDELLTEAENVKTKTIKEVEKLVASSKAEAEAMTEKFKKTRESLKKRESECASREDKLAKSLADAEKAITDTRAELDLRDKALAAAESDTEARAAKVADMLVEYTTLTNRARVALGLQPIGADEIPSVPGKPATH